MSLERCALAWGRLGSARAKAAGSLRGSDGSGGSGESGGSDSSIKTRVWLIEF